MNYHNYWRVRLLIEHINQHKEILKFICMNLIDSIKI